jgi:hypothetical protein
MSQKVAETECRAPEVCVLLVLALDKAHGRFSPYRSHAMFAHCSGWLRAYRARICLPSSASERKSPLQDGAHSDLPEEPRPASNC